MKKYIIVICTLILLTGCGTKKIDFPQEKMTQFSYQDTKIVASDYEKLLPILNQMTWKKSKKKEIKANLTINTEQEAYYFEVKDDEIILQYKNQFFSTKEKKKVMDFHVTLLSILENYNNKTFYEIEAKNDYIPTDKDTLIRMDASDHYLILKGKIPLMNLKIHKIEFVEDEIQDIDLLYSIETVSEGTSVVIRTEHVEEIRISFENQYHSQVSITMKREENGNIVFQKGFEAH